MLPIGMAKPDVYNLISSECVIDIEKLQKGYLESQNDIKIQTKKVEKNLVIMRKGKLGKTCFSLLK